MHQIFQRCRNTRKLKYLLAEIIAEAKVLPPHLYSYVTHTYVHKYINTAQQQISRAKETSTQAFIYELKMFSEIYISRKNEN